jgi:hypothetical protein
MAKKELLSRIKHFVTYYVPAIANPLAAWWFGTSETSTVWSFRTAAMVSILRALFNDPTPISMSEFQQSSIARPKANDLTKVQEDTIEPPGSNNVIEVVTRAFHSLSATKLELPPTEVATVKGEWLGLQQQEKYLCAAKQSHPVLVYLHGGQFQQVQPIRARRLLLIRVLVFVMLPHVDPWYRNWSSALGE